MRRVTRASVRAALFRAYVAGLFDGEGCIWWDGTPRISITSCNPNYLGQIKRRFGFGRVRLASRPSWPSRASFQYQASGRNALKFLTQIQPFLREKRYQANILSTLVRAAPKSRLRTAMIRELAAAKRVNHAG